MFSFTCQSPCMGILSPLYAWCPSSLMFSECWGHFPERQNVLGTCSWWHTPSNAKINVIYRDSFTIYVHFHCNNNLCHRLYISCLHYNEQRFLTHVSTVISGRSRKIEETFKTEGQWSGAASYCCCNGWGQPVTRTWTKPTSFFHVAEDKVCRCKYVLTLVFV